jgi:regulator of replication initiation timing
MSEIPGYYSQDAVDARHEQMMKEFGILGEEIENLKAENKRLKEERDELFEIFTRHVMRKMYPAKCTNVIQVFESKEEYDKVAKFIFEIIQRRENGI